MHGEEVVMSQGKKRFGLMFSAKQEVDMGQRLGGG
jgi:hypothetical protein